MYIFMKVDEWKRSHREYKEDVKRRKQSKQKQKEQLKIVRNKFEEEQVRRFQVRLYTNNHWQSCEYFALFFALSWYVGRIGELELKRSLLTMALITIKPLI